MIVYKIMHMNKITKKIERYHHHHHHHRVISSSTGAVVDDDGNRVEMAIVTGMFAAVMDAEDKNEDDERSVVFIIVPRKES